MAIFNSYVKLPEGTRGYSSKQKSQVATSCLAKSHGFPLNLWLKLHPSTLVVNCRSSSPMEMQYLPCHKKIYDLAANNVDNPMPLTYKTNGDDLGMVNICKGWIPHQLTHPHPTAQKHPKTRGNRSPSTPCAWMQRAFLEAEHIFSRRGTLVHQLPWGWLTKKGLCICMCIHIHTLYIYILHMYII